MTTTQVLPESRICHECRAINDIEAGRCLNCQSPMVPLPGHDRHCHRCNGVILPGQLFCKWCHKEVPTYW